MATLLVTLSLIIMGSPLGAITPSGVTATRLADIGAGGNRIAFDPVSGALVVLKLDGQLISVDPSSGESVPIYSATDHGLSRAAGLEVTPAGTIFLTGNEPLESNTRTISTIVRGSIDPNSGDRSWSVLAQTEAYPGGSRLFSHWMNAIAFDPATGSVLVNLGARTDHGEIQSDRDTFPTTRETGLTSILLRLPADASGLVLPNDRAQLQSSGYLFCEGLRNTYDLAFAPNGDLFGVENGPDRDVPEELNWLRQGHHYGFPWRMGQSANPQQFSDYDPATDKLLNQNYAGVNRGYYANDPTFPPPPAGITFTDPILNSGPAADHYRDPATGNVVDASESGTKLATFTAHRCPLGLSFDRDNLLPPPYTGSGFVVSWTPAQAPSTDDPGPFDPPSQDLLHLNLTPGETGYELETTRVASGFSNPVDTVLVGRSLFVLENGGEGTIWKISFPPPPPSFTEDGFYQLTLLGEPGSTYRLESSSDFLEWIPRLEYDGSETPLRFVDPLAGRLFYRSTKISE